MKSDDSLNGVLLVDKGPDMTSHDVVAVARRCLNMKKIGHCGTLDPMATGMLILVLGSGTKLQDLLMSEDKEYTGSLKLGATTSTQDREGEILEEKPVPALTEEEIKAAFDSYKGDFYQTPPMVSAIKINGVPLYKLARKGQEVEREPRFVRVMTTRSHAERCRTSTSVWCAARASMYARMLMTSAKSSAVVPTSRSCAARAVVTSNSRKGITRPLMP